MTTPAIVETLHATLPAPQHAASGHAHSLVWAVFGLSIGAVALLLLMVRRGAVAAVAALMFLVPPVAALIGYVLFGERLDMVQVAGMLLAAVGVAIATRG